MCGPCGASGNPWELVAFLIGCSPDNKTRITAWLREHGLIGERTTTRQECPARKVVPETTPIPDVVVENAHKALTEQQRRYLRSKRDLSDEVIDRYKIGFADGRFLIPIPDEQGVYRDVRCWLPPEDRKNRESKIFHWKEGYGAARLFPVDQLENDHLLLAEGELDALAAISSGFPAITVTAGARTWPDGLSAKLSGKTVTVLMDYDKAGKAAAEKRAESLARHGCTVLIAEWPPQKPEGWDITDELGIA